MNDQTCAPPVLHYIQPYCGLDEACAHVELAIFAVIDGLMANTHINPGVIGALITNCSAFIPVPSMADMIVNRYKLRGDLRVVNLSGMACSAAVTSVRLTSNMMQVMPWGSHMLVVSTTTGNN
ncbi:hypothetical protein VPH35_121142 [Triticum aestivum]